MIIGKSQGRKGKGCWLNSCSPSVQCPETDMLRKDTGKPATRKPQNHKKQPGCRNLAPVHVLIPFYSTHRTLCPKHPIIASSKASVEKPCPCACTSPVPIARKSHFVLAGTLTSADAGAILEIERFLKHFD